MNKKTFSIGILLIVIPLLGLPLFWKFFCIIALGIFLALTSVELDLASYVPKKFNRKEYEGGSVSGVSYKSDMREPLDHIPVYPVKEETFVSMHEHEPTFHKPAHSPRPKIKQDEEGVTPALVIKKTRARRKTLDSIS